MPGVASLLAAPRENRKIGARVALRERLVAMPRNQTHQHEHLIGAGAGCYSPGVRDGVVGGCEGGQLLQRTVDFDDGHRGRLQSC